MRLTSHSTGSSEDSPTAVAVEDDEVESGGDGGVTNEIIENLSKPKYKIN